MHPHERDGGGVGGGGWGETGEMEKQTDRWKEKENEPHNCYMMHYDHSVCPAIRDDG